jgi:nucleoside-diphosphate-sugar epimerase
LTHGLSHRVFCCDLHPPEPGRFPAGFSRELNDGRIRFVQVDVRKEIDNPQLPSGADLIVNLAAVHREPGHRPEEYFETNVLGAERTTDWATRTGSNAFIFVSSIAPYGLAGTETTEASLPVPVTAYGASKLVAEKIHLAWQKSSSLRRRLLIVRSGVVFGAGEQGNVSRLIRAVLRGYFFYSGNRRTRKAGGYVKELCHSMFHVLNAQRAAGLGVELYNFTMNPAPAVSDYVEAICEVTGRRRIVPSVPLGLLYPASFGLHWAARLFGIESPFHPQRVVKATKSNNIVAQRLRDLGYAYHYTLRQALDDWREDSPHEWLDDH